MSLLYINAFFSIWRWSLQRCFYNRVFVLYISYWCLIFFFFACFALKHHQVSSLVSKCLHFVAKFFIQNFLFKLSSRTLFDKTQEFRLDKINKLRPKFREAPAKILKFSFNPPPPSYSFQDIVSAPFYLFSCNAGWGNFVQIEKSQLCHVDLIG